jgi:hypothetical protein
VNIGAQSIATRRLWDWKTIFVGLIVAAIVISGALIHMSLWKNVGEDIEYIWRDAHSIFSGQNPYIKILSGNMRENQKYATYFPLFYLLGALTEAIGFRNYEAWLSFWRGIFLLFNLSIALLLFSVLYRRGYLILAIFSTLFWLFNRWTLNLTALGQIDFIPIFFLLASLALFQRNQRASLLLFSISLAAKQIGIFLAPLYLIWIWQSSDRDRLKRLSIGTLMMISVPLLTSLPFILWNAEGFFKSIIFSATRFATNHFKVASLDELLVESMPSFVGITAKLPMFFLMALIYLAALRYRLSRYAAALLILSIFVDYNSVLFRQYMAWLVPFVPLAAASVLHHRHQEAASTDAAHEARG